MRPWPRHVFDVAVVGGGPAGTATAITLLAKGRSVVVIERSHYETARIGESLPPRARLPLTRLGVWERFIRGRHLPSPGTLAAWGSAELTANDFGHSPYGNGWHLDRVRFDEMLARCVTDTGGRVLSGVRMTRCTRGGTNAWRVETDAGVLRAKFLVDATGRRESVARQIAVKRVEYDRLVGIAAFTCAQTQDARTLVEATRGGWWYSALLPNARLVVAYMTDADLLPGPESVTPVARARGGSRGSRKSELRAFWEQELEAARHTRDRVSDIAPGSSLITLAAGTSHLAGVAGSDWVAVGDAAFALDPLSSRGLYTALELGLIAGAGIDRQLRGDARGLKRYAERIESQFARYLELRTSYYSLEERWREAPFWRRRQVKGNLPALKDPLNTRDTNKEEVDNVS
jgi:flavin-dependent dehydrogenase